MRWPILSTNNVAMLTAEDAKDAEGITNPGVLSVLCG